jgi:hypothetical protein
MDEGEGVEDDLDGEGGGMFREWSPRNQTYFRLKIILPSNTYTVDKNIIATIKMRKYYCYHQNAK